MRKQQEVLSGADFRRMIAGAYQLFLREYEAINQLNVFPVPDGDTGTNMLMTLDAVTRAVQDAPPDSGIGFLSRKAADSAIMGARGNSGVILSQIFRGIARGLAGKEKASSGDIGKAFQYGILYAYRAVARPVEGTILTVAKGIARGAHRAVRENREFADLLLAAIAAGERELARTPDLLPLLKEAGVVDAGGRGLLVFLQGCLEGLGGGYSGPEADLDRSLQFLASGGGSGASAIPHPYCTEFLVRQPSVSVAAARERLEACGDSLILAAGEGLLKVHIHTARPGTVLEMAMTWGSLHDIKIDNMTDRHVHRESANAGKSGLQVLSVVTGGGLAGMMEKLGARVLAGGQTMNPPVEDFIKAVHSAPAGGTLILPNNKNILLAAAQAKKLLGDSTVVVPTTSVLQGLAALLAFDPQKSLQENADRMQERAGAVREGSITVAVRNTRIQGVAVPAGRMIGLIGGRIVAAGEAAEELLAGFLTKLLTPESELVSLYYGAPVKEAEAQELAGRLAALYPQAAVEVYQGGQPHYHYLISVE